ncbi:hypothetical protein SY88_11985 [Clostridiales bacterium PH28_bin88]|nr:hypothetical protein SY88_11985 [Clostridiales bacterium PH28_bin88]
MTAGLVCVLVTGFSISRFIFYYRPTMENGRLKQALFVAAGVVISAVTLVLSVIALWPPLEPLTFTLPFVFLILLVGAVYFIKATHPTYLPPGY